MEQMKFIRKRKTVHAFWLDHEKRNDIHAKKT